MSDIYEHYKSGPVTIADTGEGGDAETIYFISGVADRGTAGALARATAPLAVIAGEETLVRQSVHVEPEGIDCWLATVKYGPEKDEKSKERPQPGTWKFSFDTTGARHKVTKSKDTISRHWYTGQDEAPDLNQIIGYDGKQVHGVEVPVPNGKFKITAYYEPTLVTPELMRDFMRKTPRYNSDTWLGFAPGEVLYEGSRGQGDIPTVNGQRVQPIAIEHDFDASENRTNVDPLLTNGLPQAQIDVKGWEYLWYRFREVKDADDQIIPEARHAYVERLFDVLNFGDFFGFGGSS